MKNVIRSLVIVLVIGLTARVSYSQAQIPGNFLMNGPPVVNAQWMPVPASQAGATGTSAHSVTITSQHAIDQCTPQSVDDPQGDCANAISDCVKSYFEDCAQKEPYHCTKRNIPAGFQNVIAIYDCQEDPKTECDQDVDNRFSRDIDQACRTWSFQSPGRIHIDPSRIPGIFSNPSTPSNPPQNGTGAVPPGHQISGTTLPLPHGRIAVPVEEETPSSETSPEITAQSLAGGGCSLATGTQTMPFSNLLMILSMGLAPVLVRIRKK